MRAHLVGSNEPLKEHRTYYVACGACIKNATFQFFFVEDARSFSAGLSSLNTCHKCLLAKFTIDSRYVYGVVEMKQQPDSEREREEVAA
jgi:hypothetical protein